MGKLSMFILIVYFASFSSNWMEDLLVFCDEHFVSVFVHTLYGYADILSALSKHICGVIQSHWISI